MLRNLEFVWFLQTSALKCNYDYDLLDLDNHLLAFYKKLFFTGRTSQRPHLNIKTRFSHSQSGVTDFFVNKKMVFFPHWYQAEIQFNSFCNAKCNFLQYYRILSSIPQNWKKAFQEGSKDPVTPSTSICSLSCKTIYSMLLDLVDLPPPTSEKKTFSVWRREKWRLKSTSYHSKPREKLNWRCSNTKSFTEFYQRIACYTKWKKLPRPPVPFVLLSVRPCGICL